METKRMSARTYYGRFCVEPLAVGQGITLGNALRRVLLGDLPGIAATSVQLVGAPHEFCTLPGIRESVLEILLNVKQLVFSSKTRHHAPTVGYLHVEGPLTARAQHLHLPPSIRAVDPDQPIATVAPDTTLDLQLRLDEGTGYCLRRGVGQPVPSDPSSTEIAEEGAHEALAVDALFMPVTRVNYRVDERVMPGGRQERLILEVWTNGSLSPRRAIEQATGVLIRLIGGLQATKSSSVGRSRPARSASASSPSTKGESRDPRHEQTIESLDLSVRSYNCLKRANIQTVGELLAWSRDDLLQLKNFGAKSATEVVHVISQLGLALRDSPS